MYHFYNFFNLRTFVCLYFCLRPLQRSKKRCLANENTANVEVWDCKILILCIHLENKVPNCFYVTQPMKHVRTIFTKFSYLSFFLCSFIALLLLFNAPNCTYQRLLSLSWIVPAPTRGKHWFQRSSVRLTNVKNLRSSKIYDRIMLLRQLGETKLTLENKHVPHMLRRWLKNCQK